MPRRRLCGVQRAQCRAGGGPCARRRPQEGHRAAPPLGDAGQCQRAAPRGRHTGIGVDGVMRRSIIILSALVFCGVPAFAQLPNPYGASITLDAARKAAAPAIAEAAKNNWRMAIAIVDTAGDLVYFEKMD